VLRRGGVDVARRGQVDLVVEQVDQRNVHRPGRIEVERPFRAAVAEIDHPRRAAGGRRLGGSGQEPQVHGLLMRRGHARREGDDLGQGTAADHLGPDPTPGLAVGDRRRHHDDDPAAGRGVGVAVLQPRQLTLGTGRDTELPAGVEHQLVAAPVGHVRRGVAHHQVGSEVGPLIVTQGVAHPDGGLRRAHELRTRTREARRRRVGVLAGQGDLGSGEHHEQRPDPAGGVEHRPRRRPRDLADCADEVERGQLLRAGSPRCAEQPFDQPFDSFGGAALVRERLHL
jgi:hypothetical protein